MFKLYIQNSNLLIYQYHHAIYMMFPEQNVSFYNPATPGRNFWAHGKNSAQGTKDSLVSSVHWHLVTILLAEAAGLGGGVLPIMC